ncbi:hypothetical protein K9M09_01505 [Patescibacteria group bacterium]|nr:hypothetical protein [Patescibacteria group bacterium]
MVAMFVIVVIAIVVGLIISPSFRNGVVKLVTDIVTIIFGVSRVYAIVAGAAIILSLILLIIALSVQNYVFSGFVFLFACALFMIVWLPLGVVLRLFKVNSAVVPVGVRSFFAWVAFVAFLAIISPGLFSLKATLAAAVLAIFFLAIPSRIKVLEKILMPLVVIMVLVIGWQHFFPEDFRSSVRYAQSWSKRVNSSKDRGSIGNETEAATSYAQLLKDVDVLYVKSNLLLDSDTSRHLKRGDVVRLVDHKDAVTVYEGQGFVEIQLKNAQGTYFKGPKYWIEAEFVQIASPRDIVAEDESLLPSAPLTQVVSPVRTVSFGAGTYVLPIQAGETVRLITTPSKDGCGLLSMASPTFSYQFKFDGSSWQNDGPNAIYPYMRNPTCLLRSQSGDVITITVL